MAHGNATCLTVTGDANQMRIAELSKEWFSAGEKRQQEIGVEISAIINGKVEAIK